MATITQVQVPIFVVVMRRVYGFGGTILAQPQARVSARVIWPATDGGAVPTEGGVDAAYKAQRD